MKIEFRVDGHVPPKKDGANSMWNKSTEFDRLVALRRAAVTARGVNDCLRHGISLSLEVFLLRPQSATAGDLDNYITGICDGLMAAHPRSAKDPRWESSSLEAIHPSKVAAIDDDSAVISIIARKNKLTSGKSWYRVVLEGES